MATTLVTITGNVHDLINGNYDARRTKVYLRHNTPFVVDPDEGVIRLGSATLSLNDDGTFTLPDVIASADTAENLQATVYVDYADPASRSRTQQSFGPYDLSGETGTVDLSELEPVQHLDASFVSVTMATMQALLGEMEEISGLTGEDAAVAYLIENPSDTQDALSASTADSIEPGETDPQVAVDARIDTAAVGAGVSRFIARANAGATLKIVPVGDSITAGTGATLGTNDYATLVLTGLQSRFPLATITQSNRAVSGATTATIAIVGNLASAIADAGDLYIIGFGRNDAQADDAGWGGAPVQGYRRPRSLRYFEVMIRAIRAAVPTADILLVTENPASSYAGDTNMRTYQQGVRELAEAYGCELADTYTAYGTSGYGSLLSDGVHPSVAGHAVYAQTVLDRIPASLRPVGTGRAAATYSKGLRTPEGVDTTIGQVGWTVVNGSLPTSEYTQSGAGWNATYPRETSTANDYMEWSFTGTDFGIRVDQTALAAPVVDIKIDGVTVYTNQSLFLSPSSFQLYQFLATGLADGAHTIRITLKSGTLRWYQAAWLAGSPAPTPGSVGGLRKMISGRYYTQPRTSSQVAFPAAGDVFAVPIWVPSLITTAKIGVNCTTLAASSTVTLGIYRSDANDQPSTLLDSIAAISTASTGWKEGTIADALTPGWWWLAALVLGGTPRFTATDSASPVVSSAAPPNAFALGGYLHAGQSSLPTTWSSTVATATPPIVALKVA